MSKDQAAELKKRWKRLWWPVWVEPPANPMLNVVDIRAAAEAAHKVGAILVVEDEQSIRTMEPNERWDMPLWLSIMQTENVLNEVPGRAGQYSLFRTHHTVTLTADAKRQEESSGD